MRTICHYEIHRSGQSGDVDLCSACPQSYFSLCPSTETTLMQTGACRAFAFHWKLTNCKAARLCTFEIRQGYFRDHTLADFSLVPPLKKFSHGGNCVVTVSARAAPWLNIYFTLCPISICPSTEQRRPSGFPNGRWPVCFGTNSPGGHRCLHTYCSSSYPSQVSAITKLCSFNLYFIRIYQVSFPSQDSW